MKCIFDIITMALIIELHCVYSASAQEDTDVMNNISECCSKDIDSDRQLHSMDFIKVNSSVKLNSTKVPSNISDQYNTSTIKTKEVNNDHSFQISSVEHHRKKKLPLTIIIAGPAAALGIFLFLCIAFFFHNMQLNNRAKCISLTLNVVPQSSNENNKYTESISDYAPQIIPPSPSPSVRFPRDDVIAFNQKRKSTLTVPTLTVPPTIQHKRGSSLSAFADQEMLTLAAPRRHSTFII